MICTLIVYCYPAEEIGNLNGLILPKVIKGKRQAPEGYGFLSDTLLDAKAEKKIDKLCRKEYAKVAKDLDGKQRDDFLDKLLNDGETLIGQQLDFIHLIFDLDEKKIEDIQNNHYRVDLTKILSTDSLLGAMTRNKKVKFKPNKVCKWESLELIDEKYWVKNLVKEVLEDEI